MIVDCNHENQKIRLISLYSILHQILIHKLYNLLFVVVVFISTLSHMKMPKQSLTRSSPGELEQDMAAQHRQVIRELKKKTQKEIQTEIQQATNRQETLGNR